MAPCHSIQNTMIVSPAWRSASAWNDSSAGIIESASVSSIQLEHSRPIDGYRQGNAPFPAAYSGTNSLFPGYQVRETFSVTGFLGYKAFEGTEFYFNPEGFVTLARFTSFYCLPGESPATRFQCLSLASPRSKTASTFSM